MSARTGFSLRAELPDRTTFVAARGSFSLVLGEPTEGLDIAFSAVDGSTVEVLRDPDGGTVRIAAP